MMRVCEADLQILVLNVKGDLLKAKDIVTGAPGRFRSGGRG